VSLDAVSKEFPVGRGRTFQAIDGVDLVVDRSQFVCIVGASGCGKSTLLNIVGGLDHATSGSVRVEDEPVVGPGPDRGMVFQAYSLFPWKNVFDNIAFGLELAGMDTASRSHRVNELLEVMGLVDHAKSLPKELSGGMKQRVAIARALAPEPDVLLLDEPFGALDVQTKKSLQEFLRAVWLKTSATVLMVTHDVPEAVYLADRIYVMHPHPGRVAKVVDVPFGAERDAALKRQPAFLDLVDEIESLVAAGTSQPEPELQGAT
jgi:NitT/TauT family transport system ATP-binding protein